LIVGYLPGSKLISVGLTTGFHILEVEGIEDFERDLNQDFERIRPIETKG
jgi:hypothetical protein